MHEIFQNCVPILDLRKADSCKHKLSLAIIYLMSAELSYKCLFYAVFGSDDNATERTYTIGIDREEIFLFCNSSNSSISLTGIKWRVTGDNRTFPNPLIPHSNMLLQSGTNYSIQCVDTRTNTNILSRNYFVQG